MKIGKYEIDLNKLFVGTIIIFALTQLLSWAISAAFPEIPIFRGGYGFLILLAAIGLLSLYHLGKGITELRMMTSSDKFLLALYVILVILGFWLLPKFIPGIFSVSAMDFSSQMDKTIGAIQGAISGGLK